MAKIGILSFPGHWNHGANLTAYALQQALQGMGHDARNILLHCGMLKCKGGGYNEFPDEHVKTHDMEAYGESGMRRFNGQGYDTFIVGSDQVWRYNQGDPLWRWKEIVEPCFWLRFAAPGIRRISMAASFGTGTYRASKKMREAFAKELGKFSAISVREAYGCTLIRELTGKEATLLVDPVFMLPAEHWERLMAPPVEKRAKRTIAYCSFLDASYVTETLAPAFPNCDFVNLLGITTAEWLRTIHDADFVITDSFHVSCFSLIFGTPFAVLIGKHRLAVDRYYQLFNTFGVDSRGIIDTMAEKDVAAAIHAAMALPVNREEVNRLITERAGDAMSWLEAALQAPVPSAPSSLIPRPCRLMCWVEQMRSVRGRFVAKHTLARKAIRLLARICPIARPKLLALAERSQARIQSAIW